MAPDISGFGQFSSEHVASAKADAVIETSVIDLIDRQARDNPNGIAAEWKGTSVTNHELRQASIRLSAILHAKGIGPRARIPLLTSMGLEMVVAVHGILRLGACYCPMDSDSWSQARIQATLDAVGSDTIVSTTKDDILGYQVIYVGDILQTTPDSIAEGESQETLDYLQHARGQLKNCDLVYIIFTSGTTGTPKGVMVPHSSLAHLVQQDYPGSLTVYPGVKVLLLFSVAFDGK